MICPKCGSQNVNVTAVTTTKEKRKKGILYWLFIGWWWEIIAWIFFTLPKLLIAIFGKHTKTVSKTHTEALCQNCGNRWTVSNADVNRNARATAQVESASSPAFNVSMTDGRAILDKGRNFISKTADGIGERLHRDREELPESTDTATDDIIVREEATPINPSEPFWKKEWFLIVSGIVFPPVGIALIWLVYKDWDTKKKAIWSGVMAVWFIIALCMNPSDTSTQTEPKSDPIPAVVSVVSQTETVSVSDSTDNITSDIVEPDETTENEPEDTKASEDALSVEFAFEFLKATYMSGESANIIDSMELKYDSGKPTMHINFVVENGALIAYYGGENWKTLTETFDDTTAKMYDYFVSVGHPEVDVFAMLLNDADKEKVLYTSYNGICVYNANND